MPRDPGRPFPFLRPHEEVEHGRRGDRRDRRPRARGHRPGGRDARDGGEVRPLPRVRRGGRRAHMPQDEGPGGNRPHYSPSFRLLRRREPRGHLRAPLLRDRKKPPGPRDPRLPRRPARDGHRPRRRAHERPQGRGEEARGRPHRPQRARARFLLSLGARNIVLVGLQGILAPGDPALNPAQEELALLTNSEGRRGTLEDALRGTDVFLGVSAGHVLTGDMVRVMGKDPIVFALANPVPEIEPEEAREAGAKVVATGSSEHPNQVNNLLCFPGLFRGALDAGARRITEGMMKKAAEALSSYIPEGGLGPERIFPPTSRRAGSGRRGSFPRPWIGTPTRRSPRPSARRPSRKASPVLPPDNPLTQLEM